MTRRATQAAKTSTREPAAGKNPLPGWLIPVVYAAVTVVMFREFVFGQGDLLGTDTLALGYFARNFYTEFVRATHAFPRWDPLLFGGLPFVEGMHGDIFYPPSMALFVMGAKNAWGWKMVLHVFLAGLFTFGWLRALGVSRGSAFFGGLVYMLGADLVSLVYPGGDGKLFVSTLAPLVFWLTERAVARPRPAAFALLALGTALVMFTSHMQLAYFTVWGISLYALFRVLQLWRAVPARAAGVFGAFVLAGVLGVGASAVQFFPPLGYLREWSQRAEKTSQAETGYEYSTTWSLHPEEVVSLAVPEFVGDNVQTEVRAGNTYWGRNPFKLNHEYGGVIVLLLAPLLFLRRRSARAWFFAGLAVLALLYAVGATTPFFRLFYLIPGVKLFRAPSLIIFLFTLSAATLGALALDRLFEWSRGDAAEHRAARIALWGGAGVLGVLALLASSGALTSTWLAVFYKSITPDKLNALQSNVPNIAAGFWITTVLAIAVAATFEATARAMITRSAALAVLCVLAFLDLYRVDRPFVRATVLMNESPGLTALFEPDDAIAFLQQRQQQGEVFRAIDLGALMGGGYPSNALAIHGIEQLAGHHGNEMGRYRQLIGGEAPQNLVSSQLRLLNVTNTVYVLSPQPIELPGYTEAYRGSSAIVYRNPNALPRAFVAGRADVVPDEQAVARILAPTFDGRTVLLAQPLPGNVQLAGDPVANVSWRERGVNEYTLDVNTDKPGLLVVLDNFYDAWHAQVDGTEAPVLRANYSFRAVPVPAGQHTVRFYYSSPVLQASVLTSAGLLAALLLVAVIGSLRDRRTPADG